VDDPIDFFCVSLQLSLVEITHYIESPPLPEKPRPFPYSRALFIGAGDLLCGTPPLPDSSICSPRSPLPELKRSPFPRSPAPGHLPGHRRNGIEISVISLIRFW